jgi:tetrapyrrole methylase family protein / MazG family protein
VSPARIDVVGLGPGGPDLVTAGTVERIASAGHRYLRTSRHPASVVMAGATSFDALYESADSIEQVYPAIVEELVSAAQRHGEVLYAVPGSPVVAEHTVELLVRDDRVDVVLHPALSFLDLTWVRLGIDPVELGVRLVDGHRFAQEAAGAHGPLLVAQCDNRFTLSDIKLSVEETPDVTVTILQRLGLPDERILEVHWSDMDRSVEPDHLTSVYLPMLEEPLAGHTVRLEQLMARLRRDDPWKAAQSHQSLKRYLLEESYEVMEAIDRYDPDSGDGAEALCGELGDLLYQVVFHSALGAEAGWFNLSDVTSGLHDKLVRRHGHLFGDAAGTAPTIEELVRAWESTKQAEQGRDSFMDGIPADLPALARAAKVIKKSEALRQGPQDAGDPPASGSEPRTPADRLGAELWSLVERSHAAGLDAEDALRLETERRIDAIRRDESGPGRSAPSP